MSLNNEGIQHSEFTTPPRTPVASDKLSITLDSYGFPHSKLRRELKDPTRTPLCLVSYGSFSPPTFLHLRMFEIAANCVRDDTAFEVIGGYLSPVSSAYKKEGLVGANLRVKMCSWATEGHQWLSVDNFEALHTTYVTTAECLKHFQYEIDRIGGVKTGDGQKKPVRVALLVRTVNPISTEQTLTKYRLVQI